MRRHERSSRSSRNNSSRRIILGDSQPATRLTTTTFNMSNNMPFFEPWRSLSLLVFLLVSVESSAFLPKTAPHHARHYTVRETPIRQMARPTDTETASGSSSSTWSSSTTLLSFLQRDAGIIANSFQPRHLDPLLPNRHVQTILSFATRHIPDFLYVDARQSTFHHVMVLSFRFVSNQLMLLWKSHPPLSHVQPLKSKFWHYRERIETPDQDWFHVDYAYCDNNNTSRAAAQRHGDILQTRPLVLILHGLESSSDSSLCKDMAKSYLQHNQMNVATLNFRGCSSGGPNDTLGGYHLGFTSDLLHYLRTFKERHGGTPPSIYVTGFSLGGNVVLKALGELGETAVTEYSIAGAATFCVPLDAARNAPFFCQGGFNRRVYNENLLRTLRRRCQHQLERYCNGNVDTANFDYPRAMKARTITEFDDAFVAPIYGYKNAQDYYNKTSSVQFLDQIAVPTFILNARDDPFMDPSYFPLEKTQEGGGRAPVKLFGTPHGGHLGFILHKVETADDVFDTGFASMEMSRFMSHVEKSRVEGN